VAVVQSMSLEQFQEYCHTQIRDLARPDFTVPLKRSRLAMIASVKDNFQGTHDPLGNQWKPLKYPRPAGGDKPLSDTRVLGTSATAAGPGHVEELTEGSFKLGTNLDRAAIHQFGGTIKPRKAKMLSIPLTREAARIGSP